MIEKTTGYFESFDGTKIYYETRGQGEPIVLIYGIACLINHWHFQIEHFSKNYQVIAFDLRGHHKSDTAKDYENLSMGHLSQDIVYLLQHLDIKSAHFMGHSFGVPLLLSLYEQNPELIRSMVFINGFAKNPIKEMFGLNFAEPFFHFMKKQYEAQPALLSWLWKNAVDNPLSIFLSAFAGGFNLHVTQFKDVEVYARGVSRLKLSVFLTLMEDLMEYDGENTLSIIDVPTLVLSGEKDMVTPVKFQKEIADSIKDSRFLVIPYGSHCTQLDFPDYTNMKIEGFLKEIKK